MPQDPDKVAATILPDYSLGSHVAALGLSFSGPALAAEFADGAFVGEHGSWNRDPPVGSIGFFVPFLTGIPHHAPVDLRTGFRGLHRINRARPPPPHHAPPRT